MDFYQIFLCFLDYLILTFYLCADIWIVFEHHSGGGEPIVTA